MFSTSQNGGRTWTTGGLPGTTINSGRPVAADQRPVDRVRPAGQRLARPRPRDRRQRERAHPARQPLHRRRPDLGEPGGCRPLERRLLGQDLDHVRHVGAEPALRQLLHRVRRQQRGQRHEHGHVDRRRRSPGARSLSAGCSSGLGGQPVVQPNGNVVVPYSNNGGAESSFRSTNGGTTLGRLRDRRQRPGARRGREHPHVLAAFGRGRGRRAGSTSPGRTAGSAPVAARTTSSTARRWTA